MIEILQTYRFELVVSFFALIAAVWLWQSMRPAPPPSPARRHSKNGNQLAYEYLVWKLNGDIELADELIQLQRDKHGCSLKEAIDRVSSEIDKDKRT